MSTDEQADKGYSQRNQEEMLRKYCVNQSIEIRNVIYEDHSAKSFNRPEWKSLIQNLKKRKNNVNLILFTKWDHFSRNAGDAYQMISVLRGLGVEPQAIEQPLDLSIPENKMMLAFYLAAPEVENDRWALNVFYGMRRAKKEGRYMGLAPVAYINKTEENGKKYLAPKEPHASILRWAFEEIANHCVGDCTHRVNAETVNAAIKDDLLKFVPEIDNKDFYQEIISKQYQEQTHEVQFEKKEILRQIKDYEDWLSHTRDLLATGQIEASDYRDMKSQYSEKISTLESQLTRLNYDVDDVQNLRNKGFAKIIELKNVLKQGSLAVIRTEVGSIYPEKIVFDGSKVRTARRNDFLQHTNLINKKL